MSPMRSRLAIIRFTADVATCLASGSLPHQRFRKVQPGVHPPEARTRGYLLDAPLGFLSWASAWTACREGRSRDSR